MSAVIRSSQCHFRDMRQYDLDAVMQIELLAYKHPWSKAIFSDCLKAGYSGLIAELDDEVIGYGMLSMAAGEAHLLNICIRPDLQGRGYGRSLLDALVAIAIERETGTLFLEVRASNAHAQQLYLDYGFNEIGVRPAYYPNGDIREDALVYAMVLLAEAP